MDAKSLSPQSSSSSLESYSYRPKGQAPSAVTTKPLPAPPPGLALARGAPPSPTLDRDLDLVTLKPGATDHVDAATALTIQVPAGWWGTRPAQRPWRDLLPERKRNIPPEQEARWLDTREVSFCFCCVKIFAVDAATVAVAHAGFHAALRAVRHRGAGALHSSR